MLRDLSRVQTLLQWSSCDSLYDSLVTAYLAPVEQPGLLQWHLHQIKFFKKVTQMPSRGSLNHSLAHDWRTESIQGEEKNWSNLLQSTSILPTLWLHTWLDQDQENFLSVTQCCDRQVLGESSLRKRKYSSGNRTISRCRTWSRSARSATGPSRTSSSWGSRTASSMNTASGQYLVTVQTSDKYIFRNSQAPSSYPSLSIVPKFTFTAKYFFAESRIKVSGKDFCHEYRTRHSNTYLHIF